MEIRRDSLGIAHIVALSGGKDSTAMAFKLREDFPGRPFNYVITPTGDELPEMFAHWRLLADRLGAPLIPVIGGSLKSIIEEEQAIPNHWMRFCTRRLKIEPFKAFLSQVMPAVSYVGLRADEEDREGANYGGDATLSAPSGVQQCFYLQLLGWGLGEVIAYNAQLGIEVPERTDCAACFWQKLGEWYLLWLNHREIFMFWAVVEFGMGHTFRSSERDTWPTALIDLAGEFQRGRIPKVSLKRMEKRRHMCRVCTL